MLKEKEIQNIKDLLVQIYKPDKVILFGSYANGNMSKNSDLDLLIIKKTKSSFYSRATRVRNILNKYKYPFDILVFTPEEIERWINVEQSFISHIIKTGKIIYG